MRFDMSKYLNFTTLNFIMFCRHNDVFFFSTLFRNPNVRKKTLASMFKKFFNASYVFLSWIKARVLYYANNWIYTTNHKRIAVNYFWFVILSGIFGMVLATVIRLELAYPGVGIFAGDSLQYLSLATAHGVIMVFFMIIPLISGAFANFLLPTQLGVHDVAFPRLNSAAFWFLPGGLVMLGQLICLDRRYQRMNCFNIREAQSLLKKRFFADLVSSDDHRHLLDKTMLGLRFKTEDLTTLNSHSHLQYFLGLNLSPKLRIPDFNYEENITLNKTNLFSRNAQVNTRIVPLLNFFKHDFKSIMVFRNFTEDVKYILRECINSPYAIGDFTRIITQEIINSISRFFFSFFSFKWFFQFWNYIVFSYLVYEELLIMLTFYLFDSRLIIEIRETLFFGKINLLYKIFALFDLIFFAILDALNFFILDRRIIFTNYTLRIIFNSLIYVIRNEYQYFSYYCKNLLFSRFPVYAKNFVQFFTIHRIKECSLNFLSSINHVIFYVRHCINDCILFLKSIRLTFIISSINDFREAIFSFLINHIIILKDLLFSSETDKNIFSRASAWFFNVLTNRNIIKQYFIDIFNLASVNIIEKIFAIFHLFHVIINLITRKISNFSLPKIDIHKLSELFLNWTLKTTQKWDDIFYHTLYILLMSIHHVYIFLTDLCYFLIRVNNWPYHFYVRDTVDLVAAFLISWIKEKYYVKKTTENHESRSHFRGLRYDTPIFAYDYKTGNYFGKLYQDILTYLVPTFAGLTGGLRTSVWFLSTAAEEIFELNRNDFFGAILKQLRKLKFFQTSRRVSRAAFTDGFYNFFTVMNERCFDRSLYWFPSNLLIQKYENMFFNSSMQQRLYSNWRQLKFSREAWRCKLLIARHQKSLFRRYVHETGLFWSIERNARDLLPGWAMITPFSSRTRFTAIGKVDIGVSAILLVLISSIISAVNFLVTYRYLSTLNNRKMRDARSFFTEGIMCSSWMMIAANPMLIIGLIMLLCDRHWQTSFFDYSGGGDTILFQHMFWFFGHPEVYIVIIPTFGFVNTLFSYYLRKRISARASLIYSIYTIAFLGFFVWGHHMYMVGLSHTTRMLFSTLTVMISVPAATKLMHWCVTMVNSSFVVELPFLFMIIYVFLFVSGGISGMCVAHTGMDVLFHDTFYVIGHFHVMFAGAAMFACFGAFYFYFSAIFGVKYSRFYAYMHFTYYLLGQLLTVIPMFWLGYAGMPRRVLDYPSAFGGWHSIITAGHLLSVAGLISFFMMIFDSLRQGKAATRTTLGIIRYNTRLNFYLYEISRIIVNQQRGWYLYRYFRPTFFKLNGYNYRNYEYLETTLYSYTFNKKF